MSFDARTMSAKHFARRSVVVSIDQRYNVSLADALAARISTLRGEARRQGLGGRGAGLDPRAWEGHDGEQRVALEVRGVELEYGAKPRSADADEPAAETADDIPF